MMGYVYVHLCLKYNLLDSLLGMMYFTKTLRRIISSHVLFWKGHMNLRMVSITWTCPTLNSQQLLPKYLKSCVCRGLWWVSSKSILALNRLVFSLERIAATFAMQWLGTRLILCLPKFNERCGPANLQGIGRPTWGQGWSNCLFNHVTINADDQAKHRLIWVLGIVFTGIPRLENKL